MTESSASIEYEFHCWTENDLLRGWAVSYSPFMGEFDAFELKTPIGDIDIHGLEALRGLQAMLEQAIQKADQTPPIL